MPRTDEVLNTGMTSRSAAKVKKTKAEATNEKQQHRIELEPNSELVRLIINKERESILEKIWTLVNNDSPEESVKAALGSLRLYRELLDNLDNHLANILRSKDKVVQGESFNEPDVR